MSIKYANGTSGEQMSYLDATGKHVPIKVDPLGHAGGPGKKAGAGVMLGIVYQNGSHRVGVPYTMEKK